MHDDGRFIFRRRVYSARDLEDGSLGTVTVVPFTFMASTYDGTLGALGVVTIWLFVVAIKDLTTCWRGWAAGRRSA